MTIFLGISPSFNHEIVKKRKICSHPILRKVLLNTLTIVQWFTWGVSVGYEWLPTVVPLRNTVVPLKNIVDSTWVSQEL